MKNGEWKLNQQAGVLYGSKIYTQSVAVPTWTGPPGFAIRISNITRDGASSVGGSNGPSLAAEKERKIRKDKCDLSKQPKLKK